MRHRHVVVVAAVALAGLAGCADRPNDLDTYYDDPTPSSAPEAPEAQSAPVAPSTPMSTGPDLSAFTRVVHRAAFTAADLADEGVRPDDAGSGLARSAGCLTTLAPVTAPALRKAANWRYPSGSALRQDVTAYPARDGAGVVAAAACDGQSMELPVASGVDLQRAWCAASTCTVLLAKGHVVSGVEVTAGSRGRAGAAAERLAKVAAAKLADVEA